MKPEIKQRIEQIKAGQVPAGYKRTKAGIMPCEWCSEKEYKAKDVFKSVTNKKHNGEFEVLSATQDKGVIPRSQVDIDIKFNEDNIVGYKKVDKGDFVISLRSFQGGIEYSEYEGLVSPAYTVLKPKIPICDGYYKAYLKTVDYISRLNKGTYGIRDGKQIGFEDFGDMIIHYPSLVEQEKIVEILSAQDKVIELKEKLLEEKKKQKKYLMQQLLTGKKRLPGFSEKWLKYSFSQLFETLSSRNHQITSEEYLCDGLYPVVDQGKKKIVAYSNNREKLFSIPDGGTIVFGDHTREVKYIDFDFIVGADGTQILKSANYITSTLFLYYTLSNRTIKNDGYSRHFKYIKEFNYYIPSIKEQEAITKILRTVDEEFELFQKELDQEKQKKKALMQLLLTGIVRV